MIGIITKLKNIASILIIITIVCAFFTNAEILNDSVIQSLNFCYYTIIPSLFPYMIISSLFSRSYHINQALSAIFKKIFSVLGICRIYTSQIILGNLCGFINGPKSICEHYNTKTSNYDFNKAITLSSNAGLSFVVFIVGIKLWQNIYFGIVLYFFQVIVSFLINFSRNSKSKFVSVEFKNQDPYQIFSSSITSSAKTIFNICAFTIFSSLLVNILTSILNIKNSSCIYVLLSSFVDITQGVKSSLSLQNNFLCAFFTGFSVGFGGLSVAFQTFSICAKFKVIYKKFILMKFIQGIICGLFASIFASLFDIEPKLNTSILTLSNNSTSKFVSTVSIFLFFIVTSVDFFENIIYNNIIKEKGENHGRK